jgi:hypothetical protein
MYQVGIFGKVAELPMRLAAKAGRMDRAKAMGREIAGFESASISSPSKILEFGFLDYTHDLAEWFLQI